MHYSIANQRLMNVYHVLGTGNWTATLLGSLLLYFDAWETGHALARRNTSCQYQGGYAVDLADQHGAFAQLANTVDGTQAGDVLPNNVTLAIKAATAKRGRSFRGRTYWIGAPEAWLDASGNAFQASEVNAIVSILELLRTGTIPNGGALVVRSIRSGGAYRTTGLMTPLTGWVSTDNTVDSQRRRLPGHNIHR